METRLLVKFPAVPRYAPATRRGSEEGEERYQNLVTARLRPRGRRRLSRLLADCVVAGRNLKNQVDAITAGARLIACFQCFLLWCAQRVDQRSAYCRKENRMTE